MGTGSTKRRWPILAMIGCVIVIGGIVSWTSFFAPAFQPWWYTLAREGRKLLGREKPGVPAEGNRIREEVILKKMEEASAQQDWRTLAPDYPRPKKTESLQGQERLKALKSMPEFQALDKEVRDYLKKKDSLIQLDPPSPPVKDIPDVPRMKDKAEAQIMERLLASKEKPPVEKPLEENIQLGIKGPLVSRKILERPSPPQVKVSVEAEIEMTIWVLPNGIVDRVLPSVKGDAELERIAIRYLKLWRFTPLPRDHSQVEQWGTVPMKFRLQ